MRCLLGGIPLVSGLTDRIAKAHLSMDNLYTAVWMCSSRVTYTVYPEPCSSKLPVNYSPYGP